MHINTGVQLRVEVDWVSDSLLCGICAAVGQGRALSNGLDGANSCSSPVNIHLKQNFMLYGFIEELQYSYFLWTFSSSQEEKQHTKIFQRLVLGQKTFFWGCLYLKLLHMFCSCFPKSRDALFCAKLYKVCTKLFFVWLLKIYSQTYYFIWMLWILWGPSFLNHWSLNCWKCLRFLSNGNTHGTKFGRYSLIWEWSRIIKIPFSLTLP